MLKVLEGLPQCVVVHALGAARSRTWLPQPAHPRPPADTLPLEELTRRRDAAAAAVAAASAGAAAPATAQQLADAVRRFKPGASEQELSDWVGTYLVAGYTLAQVERDAAEEAELRAKREAFSAAVCARGYVVEAIEAKGNCMFGAVAHQVYGDEQLHGVVRAGAVAFLRALHARDEASAVALDPDIRRKGGVDAYLAEMARDRTWGDCAVLRACADLYGREVLVLVCGFGEGVMPSIDFPGPLSLGATPALVLSNYTGATHFDSCVDAHTLAHRLPPETAGEVEAAALARLEGEGGGGGGGGGGGSSSVDSQKDTPGSPHGILSSGGTVGEHVRGGLIASLSQGGGGGEGREPLPPLVLEGGGAASGGPEGTALVLPHAAAAAVEGGQAAEAAAAAGVTLPTL